MTAVLFVDDDRSVLDGLRRSLHGRLPGVSLHVAGDGTEACARLHGEPVDVVVTDLHMPGVDGTEVLAAARAIQPHAARMVLSGWVDEAQTLRSLQYAHRCLSKPVTPNHLVSTVQVLVRAVAAVPMPLRGCLGKLVTLPSRPTVLQALRWQLSASAPEPVVTATVEGDAALSLTVLHVAVRAAGDDDPPASVAEAVRRLGTTTLRHLVEQTALLDDRWAGRGWAATVAEVLADFVRTEGPAAPWAGMAGVLALAACSPDAMRRLLASTGAEPEALTAAERAAMGLTHREVGDALLRLWGVVPPGRPGADGGDLQAALVELAALARATEPGRLPPAARSAQARPADHPQSAGHR